MLFCVLDFCWSFHLYANVIFFCHFQFRRLDTSVLFRDRNGLICYDHVDKAVAFLMHLLCPSLHRETWFSSASPASSSSGSEGWRDTSRIILVTSIYSGTPLTHQRVATAPLTAHRGGVYNQFRPLLSQNQGVRSPLDRRYASGRSVEFCFSRV